ncbi:SusC/RagA family TonB-linked outer membrane protein [Saccharicrinis aurantiacus]|uniref:SusC/RagA family TonB-linked outer membrane protein n=1 Tax=Saccharicrinis aurantiacus TaxID=1849719 RepID=UPI00249251DC|nr:SusC/RagA family TonB-linked outer membrane protein [Saccharicrinis aurantiacus]
MKKPLSFLPFWIPDRYRDSYVPIRISFLVFIFLFSNFSLFAKAQGNIILQRDVLTVEELFKEVKTQTGYTVIYNNSKLNGADVIALPKQNLELDNLMHAVLKERALDYEVEGDYIIVRPQKAPNSQDQTAIKKIAGTVVDEEGYPLPGVAVLIKGTQKGTATNIDGEFQMSVPTDAIIVVSFIGMITQEVSIEGRTKLVVTLKSELTDLDEVVVTGYQRIDRRLFTGSAAKLNTDEVKLDAVPDVSKFLQGQVAGVSVDNVSGTFGTAPVVRIRGNASINGNNKPLWVVDGVILEDLVEVTADDLTSGNLSTVLSSGVAGLNPDDIEDIQVLKDASATALYGAQAMNGVIVINTKSGKKGKMRVNYSGSVAVKERPNYGQFDIANSAEEISLYKELARKGWIDLPGSVRAKDYGVMGKMYSEIAKNNIGWGANGTVNEAFLSKYANANTDWFDELFQNSIVNQHSLSFSGGSEKMNYYASLSYYNDNGRTIADNVSKYTGTMKMDFQLTDKFNVGLKLSFSHRDQELPGSKDREFNAVEGVYKRDFDINPFSYALNTSRSMRAYDENGDLEYFRRDYNPFNIIHELENNKVELAATDLVGQLNLDYQFTKDLSISSISQIRRNTALREHMIHENSNQANAYRAMDTQFIRDANQLLFSDPDFPNSNPYSILPTGGFYNTVDNSLDFFSTRNSISYNPTINDTHIMSFLFGQEIKYANRKEISSNGWGIQYDRGNLYSEHAMLSKYLSLQNQNRESLDEVKDRFMGLFFNAAYSYKGKYTFNGTVRRDGSNQLGKTKTARYLNSWNVSGKWNITEENFMEGINGINLLSLKSTYGLSGVMGPSASAIEKLIAYQTWRPYDKETGIEVEDLTNEDLSWEKMYEFSLGMEAAFLNNRIYTDFAYYQRNSFDLVGSVRTSGVGGEHIKYGNFADMETKGFEIMLNTVNVIVSHFKWNSSINLDYNTNEITKLDNYNTFNEYVSNTGGNMLGKPRRGLYSVEFAGLDQFGLPQFVNTEGEPMDKNLNWQERKDAEKYLKYEGLLDAPLSGGFNNTFEYKNLSLGVGLVFRAGNKVRLDDLFTSEPEKMGTQSISKELVNRWSAPGDENYTNVPAIMDMRFDKDLDSQSLNIYEMYNKSDVRVADGSFVRLRNISLGYNIPATFAKKMGMQRAKVSFQAQNICLLYSDSKLNGLDPEFYRSGGVSLPVPRTYTFSLNLSF